MTKTAEMTEPQRKWIAALRSGRYQQGRRYLRIKTEDGVRHCVIGVACEELAGEESPYLSVERVCTDVLRMRETTAGKLMEWNDEHYLTFIEIADLIEGDPQRYFRGESE